MTRRALFTFVTFVTAFSRRRRRTKPKLAINVPVRFVSSYELPQSNSAAARWDVMYGWHAPPGEEWE
jgi:hypothetical protein